MKPRNTYNGGKGGAGVYQQIINQMPPHRVYIESHLGSGQVMRHKIPAAINYGLDLDASMLAQFGDASCLDIKLDAIDATLWLRHYDFQGDELIYADPPYLHSTRKRLDLYKYEMTQSQHIELLETLRRLPCYVIISGYWSELYADLLQGWRTHSFQAMTRKGVANEWLWMNYPQPAELHDYRYLGADYRERERIKRKIVRWQAKLQGMTPTERYAMLAALGKTADASSLPRIIGVDLAKDSDKTAFHHHSPEVQMRYHEENNP